MDIVVYHQQTPRHTMAYKPINYINSLQVQIKQQRKGHHTIAKQVRENSLQCQAMAESIKGGKYLER